MKIFPLRSLKTRVTIFTLAVFVLGISALSFYTNRILYDDMERLLGEQQMSVVSTVAQNVNDELSVRLLALETIAREIDADLLGRRAALQAHLEQRPLLQILFNAGIFLTDFDGTAIADVPLSVQRIGVSYRDRDFIAAVLKDGKSVIGQPVMGKKLLSPTFAISVPVRDAQGKTIGVLVGATDLGKPNFLDKLTNNLYGKHGGYILVAPKTREIITATDKNRIMEQLPAPGDNRFVDRNIAGYEGYSVLVNALGEKQLASVKKVPVAAWYMLLGTPTAEAFAPLHNLQQRLLLATLFFTLLAGALIWWFFRRQFLPLTNTASAMLALADSKQIPLPLPVQSGDEIGQLAGGFNRLLETWAKREAVLKENQQNLAITLHSIGDGVIATDTAGRITQMNPTAERLTGWALADALGRPLANVFRIVNATTRKTVSDPVELVMAHGKVVGLANHTVLLARDGSEYQIADSAAPIRNGDDNIVGVVLVFSDVSAKYQSELALQHIHLMMERSESMARLASFEWDVDANTVTWSPEMFRIFDRDPALGAPGLAGQAELYTPESGQKMLDAVRKALAEGMPYELELMSVQPNGELRPCFVKGFPERDENGRVIRIAGLVQDITEKAKTELEIRTLNANLEERVRQRTAELEMANQLLVRATKEAETANIAKSAFLANMSHEIRTPMNGILGMADILRREGVTAKQAQRLDNIDTSAQHLLSVINNILDLSKIEAGKFTLEEAPVVVSSLLANISSILGARASAKGIDLQIEIDHMPRNLIGDPTRLQQALLNYATNAIKFTEHGSVTLRACVQEETTDSLQLRFEVQDTGIGIATNALSRVFGAFEQADNSMNRKYGGTGLGLAITRRLAELMGGEAGAESALGIGSTFWFTVRLKKESISVTAPTTTTVDAEAQIKQYYCGQRVLVVDDEPINREIAQLQFEAADLIVDTAEDGAEAVTLARNKEYAAIFMDMQMPTLNGLEATQQLRQLSGYRQTPIIAMTANAFAEDKALCIEAGMDDFLIKPFTPDTLFATLLRALNDKAAWRRQLTR